MNDQRNFMAYLNGRILPYSQVVAELQKNEAQSAGGFYDAERTFGGKVFRLRNHLERLYNGLNYSQIDPGLTLDEMEEATFFLLQENGSLLQPGEEFTITQIVSLTQPDIPAVKRPDSHVASVLSPSQSGYMKVRAVLRILKQDGWVIQRTRGSHRQLKHPTERGTVTVSGNPGIEMPPGTLNSILKQARLK